MRKNYSGKPISDMELARDRTSLALNDYNIFLKQDLTDLNPVSVGQCRRSNNSWDSQRNNIHTTDCTNLYYILDGSGTLFLNDECYAVKAGDFFVVPLGARATLTTPMSSAQHIPHRWIGFIGTLSHDFECFPIPFTLPPEVVAQLCDPAKEIRNLESRLTADLFLIHSYMKEPQEHKPDYVQKIVNLVNASYMEKLSVTQMAKDFGLDRCHLSRLFKTKMNMSIQDYILQFRLAKAKRYLKHNFSVTDTAHLCGFNDRANFTKLFTREIGCSPTEWVDILDWESWNRPR